jgi:hypothetical protein
MSAALRAANALFALLFVFSVVVQYNDPDPVRWMAVYALGILACVAWERRVASRARWAVPAIALTWAGAWLHGLHLGVPAWTALTDWGMHSEGSEELRETCGLALVAAWTGLLAARPRRRAG